MSQLWEDLENKAKLSKQKITCWNCGHQFVTAKKDPQCSRCNRRQQDSPIEQLNLQEIPSVTIKEASLEIGRFCLCGCGRKIPDKSRKDRKFFNGICRRVYANTIRGYSESKNVIRARLHIKKPIMLSLYPQKGKVIKIEIPDGCIEIMKCCEELEKERN